MPVVVVPISSKIRLGGVAGGSIGAPAANESRAFPPPVETQ